MTRRFGCTTSRAAPNWVTSSLWACVTAAVAIRPDGLEAAVTTDQGVVVWDLDPAHWVQGACALAGRNLTRAEWDQYIGDLASYHQTCPEFDARVGEPSRGSVGPRDGAVERRGHRWKGVEMGLGSASPAMFGREAEVAATRRFFARLDDGPAELVLSGPPGIRKTRLWSDAVVATRVDGRRVITTCPVEGGRPAGVRRAADLVGKSASDVLAELPAPQRHALAVVLLLEELRAGPGDPAVVAASVVSAVRVLRANGSLVVAVNDAQWLDEPSRAASSRSQGRQGTLPARRSQLCAERSRARRRQAANPGRRAVRSPRGTRQASESSHDRRQRCGTQAGTGSRCSHLPHRCSALANGEAIPFGITPTSTEPTSACGSMPTVPSATTRCGPPSPRRVPDAVDPLDPRRDQWATDQARTRRVRCPSARPG